MLVQLQLGFARWVFTKFWKTIKRKSKLRGKSE
ncbi:hypothetical protein PspLS_08744 [Pyricularia sp. CBS 133598]|nr:hypothetical protein PspLS_08744 [Pyricularia sp. CBS 133598]